MKFPLFYDNYFVPRGYAVLNVDMDGTTKSDGCPTSGGLSDVLGGKAVVDWLNGRATAYDAQGKKVKATWTSGRTAMIGKSYDGTLANGVAATGVEGLDDDRADLGDQLLVRLQPGERHGLVQGRGGRSRRRGRHRPARQVRRR